MNQIKRVILRLRLHVSKPHLAVQTLHGDIQKLPQVPETAEYHSGTKIRERMLTSHPRRWLGQDDLVVRIPDGNCGPSTPAMVAMVDRVAVCVVGKKPIVDPVPAVSARWPELHSCKETSRSTREEVLKGGAVEDTTAEETTMRTSKATVVFP